MADGAPDLFTLYMLGTAVQEMRQETKRDIEGLIYRGGVAEKLLAECLPFLRSTEAKSLRARVITALENAKVPK